MKPELYFTVGFFSNDLIDETPEELIESKRQKALDNLYHAIKQDKKKDITRAIIYYRKLNPDRSKRNGWKRERIIREVLRIKEG